MHEIRQEELEQAETKEASSLPLFPRFAEMTDVIFAWRALHAASRLCS